MVFYVVKKYFPPLTKNKQTSKLAIEPFFEFQQKKNEQLVYAPCKWKKKTNFSINKQRTKCKEYAKLTHKKVC